MNIEQVNVVAFSLN